MKKLILLFIIFFSLSITAQTIPAYKNIRLTGIPDSTTKSDSIVGVGADGVLKKIKRSNFTGSTPNLQAVTDGTGNNITLNEVMSYAPLPGNPPSYAKLIPSGAVEVFEDDGMSKLTIYPSGFQSAQYGMFNIPAKDPTIPYTLATTSDITDAIAGISIPTPLLTHSTIDGYIGDRLSPLSTTSNGYFFRKSINGNIGYSSVNSNTGNGACSTIGVGIDPTDNYNNSTYLAQYGTGYYISQLAGNGGIMSNTKLLFGTYNENDIDFITGTTYAGMTSKLKINYNGQLSIGTTPTIGTTSDKILLRDSSGNIKQTDYPSIPSVGTWGGLNYPSWSSGTPFVKMNASGSFILDTNTYLTSITSGNVTTALGYTPYNATNPAGYISSVPAQSFASLTGKPTTLSGYGITDAYSNSNPSGFVNASYVNSQGFLTTVSSSNITSALGYTPANNLRRINTYPLTSDVNLTCDDITDGTTYKSYSATDKAKVSTIDQSVSAAEKATWNAKQSALGFTPVNNTTTVNGHPLSSNITVTANDVSAVPTTRTVNGHALSSDVTVTSSDLGINTPSIMRLTSSYTGTSSTTLQKLFNVGSSGNGSFPAVANKAYYFKCIFNLSGLSSTSNTISFGILGTASISDIFYSSRAVKNTGVGTSQQVGSATISATILTTSSTSTVGYAEIEGTFSVTGSGTVIPSFATSVSTTPVVGIDSYFEITPIGSATFTATPDIN